MRGFSKKMLISILTSVVVFVTMIATTFAWVGIFTYANTECFNLNLKVQDLDSNYFLTISSTGKKDSFSSEVSSIELKKQMLKSNFGDKYDDFSNDAINSVFRGYSTLTPITTVLSEDKNIASFEKINLKNKYSLEFIETDEFLKFDLYLSVNTKEGINEETTGIKSNVYLNNIDKCLEGIKKSFTFTNKNPFKELPSSSTNDFLKTIPETFNMNTKNCARFALAVYDPIKIDDEYSNEAPAYTKIFQGGSNEPEYDYLSDSYDLGGILPEEQNTALIELLYIRDYYKKYSNLDLFSNKLNTALARNDLELVEENRQIWNKSEHESYLGCMDGIQTKMKISVYLWFEGWDSDCINSIDSEIATLNLSFTSGTDD